MSDRKHELSAELHPKKGAGRPKKERPADPLAPAREGSHLKRLPAPSTRRGENIPAAALELARQVKALGRLDDEISALNKQKSEIYQVLRGMGLDIAQVKRAAAELKVDPLVRARRIEVFEAYVANLNAALDSAEADAE